VAPDSVRCTRAVQLRTSHSREFQGALRYNSLDCSVCHRTVRCATGLSGEPAKQRLSAPMVDSAKATMINSTAAEGRAAKSEGTGLSGAALDCPVRQGDKGSNGRPAPNPNGCADVVHTGQSIVAVRWRTGLSGAPIASSLHQQLWKWLGAINTPNHLIHSHPSIPNISFIARAKDFTARHIQ
jgi:hypothetical protein